MGPDYYSYHMPARKYQGGGLYHEWTVGSISFCFVTSAGWMVTLLSIFFSSRSVGCYDSDFEREPSKLEKNAL